MRECIIEFKDYLERNNKSLNTVSSYIMHTEIFLKWIEDRMDEPFDNFITDLDVRLYKQHLNRERKQSFSTINTKMAAIQSFADFLYVERKMDSKLKVERLKGNKEPAVEILEKSELYKYMRHTMHSNNKLHIAIVYVLLNTGIRVSELCNLELDDIYLSERKGRVVIRSGKGGRYREVPLNADARKYLAAYIDDARPETESQRVFIGQRGPLTRMGVYKIIHKIGERSINKEVYPHMLRHQCFTKAAKSPGADMKTIAQIAGHSSIELTSKFYINSSLEEQEELMEGLDFFI